MSIPGFHLLSRRHCRVRGPTSGIPIAEAIGTGQEVTRHQEVDIRGNNRERHVSFKFGQNRPVEFNIQICSKCLRYKPKFLSALSFMVILLSKTGHKATGRFPCASRTAAPRGVGIAAWPKRTESVPPRDRAAGANPGARRQLSEASRSAARQNVESHLGIPSVDFGMDRKCGSLGSRWTSSLLGTA